MSTTQLAIARTGMGTSAAVLKIDGLDLLFQQSDIRALESSADVDCGNPGDASVGWITYMRQRWQVYCLSDQLDLMGSVPSSRRTCALLATESGYFGMLCDDLTIVKQVAGQRHDIPLAMKNADTPILGLLPSGGKLLCVCSPNLLAAHIERLIHKQSLQKELPCLA